MTGVSRRTGSLDLHRCETMSIYSEERGRCTGWALRSAVDTTTCTSFSDVPDHLLGDWLLDTNWVKRFVLHVYPLSGGPRLTSPSRIICQRKGGEVSLLRGSYHLKGIYWKSLSHLKPHPHPCYYLSKFSYLWYIYQTEARLHVRTPGVVKRLVISRNLLPRKNLRGKRFQVLFSVTLGSGFEVCHKYVIVSTVGV